MDIVNSFLKNFTINILIFYIFNMLINNKENNIKSITIIIISSLSISYLWKILNNFLDMFSIMMIIYSVYGIIISKVTKNKIGYSIIITFCSVVVVYTIHIISILITSTLLKLIFKDLIVEDIKIITVSIIIETFLLIRIFKIRRLKDGIIFLKNQQKVSSIGGTSIFFIGLAFLIYSLLGMYNDHVVNTYIFIAFLIESICITIWLRKKITTYYKQKLKEKTVSDLENEIKEKDEEISKILEENQNIAKINHKYSNRIKALESVSNKIFENKELVEKMKTEFGNEFVNLQEQINSLSEDFSKEMESKVKHTNTITKTGIFGIDNILEYMKEEADKNNIKFDVKVNGSIKYMVENVIPQNKLETLLGDHIKDAIIAISSGNNTYRSILVVIGIVDKCYEIKIYDTGIEFEIETLLELGTKAITTHKDTGGSGIGFMTTFETIKELKASLIIEEKHEMTNTDYTKAVCIKFDGKDEYRIHSYRAEKIKEQNKENRIIIENLKA